MMVRPLWVRGRGEEGREGRGKRGGGGGREEGEEERKREREEEPHGGAEERKITKKRANFLDFHISWMKNSLIFF